MSLVGARGVDISSCNGDVNMEKIKNAGYDFVMIRCGYGSDFESQDDTQFENNVRKCEALGLPWGVYLYSYALSAEQARSEVEHVKRLLKGKKPTLPVAIDIEDADGYHANHGGWNFNTINTVTKTFIEGIRAAKYYPMLYTGFDELENLISPEVANSVDIWFAQWWYTCDYKGSNLSMWQYGGETNYIESNSIPGVGVIDKDKCYKDYPTIIKQGGYNGWSGDTPTPVPVLNAPSIYTQGVADGNWLKVVKDGSTYSGILGKPLVAFAAKVTEGIITYSAHLTGSRWLGDVTGWDYKDYINGYAGSGNPAQDGAAIDAIKMYYKTPQEIISKYGYYKVAYRVHLLGYAKDDWLDWQFDTETTNNQKGYAGVYGTIIDGIQAKLVKA